MKKLLLPSLVAIGAAMPASAGVVFLDLGNLSVPNNNEGVYINIVTGATALSFPADFNEAPWVNLYLGGIGISNSDLLRPWASQPPGDYNSAVSGNYFLNVAPSTLIDGSGVFVSGESNSELHIGGNADQFQSGSVGYLAFAYESSVGGGTSFGWLSFTPNSGGDGVSFSLARTDTPGEALIVGPIPEPAAFAGLAGAVALGAVVSRRGRRV